MALLTTGLIENTAVSGVRPTTTLVIRITNDDTVSGSVRIVGFWLNAGVKTQYVEETVLMDPGSVITRNHFAQFDAFEFQFTTSSTGIEISTWGKSAAGNLTAPHRVLPAELANVAGTQGLSTYGYIFNGDAQVVPGSGDVGFSDNGVIVGSITHTAGSSNITLGSAGTYAIWFYVAGTAANQFTLHLNGNPIDGATYSSVGAAAPNPGMVIITAAAGDVVTLRNDSALPVTLANGTVVNASVLIQRIDS